MKFWMKIYHDGRGRLDWNRDNFRATKLLYSARHSVCPSCHYPDLWLKMANLYDRLKNPQLFLQTNRHKAELLVKHKKQLRPKPNVELFMKRTKL